MFGTIRAKLAGEFIILVGLGVGIGYSVQVDNPAAVIFLSLCAGSMAHMLWRTLLSFKRANNK